MATRTRKPSINAQDLTEPFSLADVEFSDDLGAEAEISLGDEPIAMPSSLFERMKAKIKSSFEGTPDVADKKPAPRGSRKRDVGKEVFDQFVPLAAMLLMWGSAAAIRDDDYSACALQRDEATAIIAPPLRILARRIKATGRMTDDSLDLLIMLTALALYGERSISLAHSIRKSQRERHGGTDEESAGGTGQQQYRSQTTQGRGQPDDVTHHRTNQSGSANDPDTAALTQLEQLRRDASYPTDGYADLYQQDAIGRRQLGLS